MNHLCIPALNSEELKSLSFTIFSGVDPCYEYQVICIPAELIQDENKHVGHRIPSGRISALDEKTNLT